MSRRRLTSLRLTAASLCLSLSLSVALPSAGQEDAAEVEFGCVVERFALGDALGPSVELVIPEIPALLAPGEDPVTDDEGTDRGTGVPTLPEIEMPAPPLPIGVVLPVLGRSDESTEEDGVGSAAEDDEQAW